MNECIFGSCSNDCTFRLWDINKNKTKEILIQEGHKYPINYFNFHPDGSLVLTCDSGGFLLLWDLRVGKKILSFNGHVNNINKCKFDNLNSVNKLKHIYKVMYKISTTNFTKYPSASLLVLRQKGKIKIRVL